MSRESDLRKVFKRLETGFTVERNRKGHHEVRDAQGRKVATFSGTGGRGRGDANGMAELLRAKAIKR
jgi:hypothetical protein